MKSLWRRCFERRRARLLRAHVWLLAVYCVWSAAAEAGILCPFYMITGIGCPACGTTRALSALMRGNVRGYLFYQPFAPFLAAAAWGSIHGKGRCARILCAAVFLLNFIYWAARLF